MQFNLLIKFRAELNIRKANDTILQYHFEHKSANPRIEHSSAEDVTTWTKKQSLTQADKNLIT